MDKNLQIFIKNLDEKTMTINANSSNKILTIKEKIHQKKKNLSPNDLILNYAGKQLENEKTLFDYNIQNEATFHLTMRLRGGKTIYIKTLMGDLITIEAEDTDTIAVVKEKIEKAEGIPQAEQRLMFNNKKLADNKTLKDYNIDDEETLQLVLRKG